MNFNKFNIPQLTIITINKNGGHSLQNTIDSVLRQKNSNFKWILVDGYSSDVSKNIIDDNIDNFDALLFDSNGIYSAMNYGISETVTDWILFLNGGDMLVDSFVIDKFMNISKTSENMVMGGFIKDGIKRSSRRPSTSSIFYGMPTCHQAIFYKNLCINFDIKYKYAGDFLQTLTYFNLLPRPLIVDWPVCISKSGGVSDIYYFRQSFEYLAITWAEGRYALGLYYFILRLIGKFIYTFFPPIYIKIKRL